MLVKIQGILPNSTWSGGFSWEWRNWESLWRLSRTWTWWCHRSYFHPNNDEDDGEGACSGKTNQFHQNRLIEKVSKKEGLEGWVWWELIESSHSFIKGNGTKKSFNMWVILMMPRSTVMILVFFYGDDLTIATFEIWSKFVLRYSWTLRDDCNYCVFTYIMGSCVS